MIEGGLPQMVLWELPEEATAVESSIPQPGGRPVDMINRGFPSYTGEVLSRAYLEPKSSVIRARLRQSRSFLVPWETLSPLLETRRDRKVCMIVRGVNEPMAVVVVDAATSASDTRTRPQQA
ncbi:hypothetical protein PPTG_24659 [Phytophthora nicotianae INRA-310]|uniref:Uncharacterized protein n=1 Tax=Phytophthora nicotianae (strain INRA-310) TaxID=761204 RepID=W2PBW8_PHYN3|nr:hypothetical protein PPTG_24659 [Phytophthora nicotianae INRA-310]ETM98311.1 hypothetical protein PPTG_24659 [Phytophthora nicotianae INRA-310]